MTENFRELYNVYEQSIVTQKNVIGSYREKLNLALRNRDFKEIKRLNSLLRVLYEEKSELEERAVELNEYIKAIPHNSKCCITPSDFLPDVLNF